MSYTLAAGNNWRGFTIVELLIVIVVIGILAGITIVAYSGITNRANQSKVQANALSVQSVAESFSADKGYYPALAATGVDSFGTGSTSTKLPSGVSLIPDAATSTITSASGSATLAYSCYLTCTASTGGRIQYWDPVAGSLKQLYVGKAVVGGAWAYPAT